MVCLGVVLWVIARFALSTVQVEKDLKSALAGAEVSIPGQNVNEFEVVVAIGADGSVSVDGENFDPPGASSLPALTKRLLELQEQSRGQGQTLLVTLQTQEQTKYELITQVMDALAAAKIVNVTFMVGAEEL